MSKKPTETTQQSRKMWARLEEWVREMVQWFTQMILVEEVTELLGRQRSERRQAVDAPPGSRNGYDTPRKLTLRGLLGYEAPLSASTVARL